MKGCGQTRFLEIHHLVPRAAGGKNRQDNLVTLCASCHRLLHEKYLKGELPVDGLIKARR
jgi:5-methylcytosine-specific restriction endonuclease McrA